MAEITYYEIIIRLVLAVILGGVVGFERESHRRPAGFRTHILVCVGAALAMMVSAYGFSDFQGYMVDPSRIAAQVVTGVGFLGAGTILRHGSTITGLTTAASIWIVSGIGLAIGIGFYLGAVVATLMALISLIMLRSIEGPLAKIKRLRRLMIRGVDRPKLVGRIGAVLGDMDVHITHIDLSHAEYEEEFNKEVLSMELLLRIPSGLDTDKLLQKVASLPDVLEVRLEGEELVKKDYHPSFDDEKENNPD